MIARSRFHRPSTIVSKPIRHREPLPPERLATAMKGHAATKKVGRKCLSNGSLPSVWSGRLVGDHAKTSINAIELMVDGERRVLLSELHSSSFSSECVDSDQQGMSQFNPRRREKHHEERLLGRCISIDFE